MGIFYVFLVRFLRQFMLDIRNHSLWFCIVLFSINFSGRKFCLLSEKVSGIKVS